MRLRPAVGADGARPRTYGAGPVDDGRHRGEGVRVPFQAFMRALEGGRAGVRRVPAAAEKGHAPHATVHASDRPQSSGKGEGFPIRNLNPPPSHT